MSWRDLIETEHPTTVMPWLGGQVLRDGPRRWTIDGARPGEHGWYWWKLVGRLARGMGRPSDIVEERLKHKETGYLVGDRFVTDLIHVSKNPLDIVRRAERVHLITPGLDRFVRVEIGRMYEGGPMIFCSMGWPLGPEPEVQEAFEDEKKSVDHVSAVSPALDASFRMETWQRDEAEKYRLELARKRREEEEKLAKEKRRQELVEKIGDGAGRRELAKLDFREAAKAALSLGGATYLDHKQSVRKSEMVVKFRLMGRRFECVCDKNTLRIIDSGICLIDHANNDFKYDNFFTLESLPGVIQQANHEGKLVVFRHV